MFKYAPFMSLLVCLVAHAGDAPQWGERHTRNMVSPETGLAVSFNPETGENVKWSVSLGTHGYALPSIANGKVLIGANNAEPRDERLQGDCGVLLCLDEDDGSLDWQLVVPRIMGDRHNDWPLTGICSPPTIEGDRVYVMTNRSEIVCLDLKGQANGNDGPYKGEGWHMVFPGEPSIPVTALDGDIIWLHDMRQDTGICAHDSPHASILLDGDFLYANTCNGVNYKHGATRAPDAPSLIVLDKRNGRVVAEDGEHFGPRIAHSSWSSPSMGTVNGRKLVFFGGPDGIAYAFNPPGAPKGPIDIQTLERVWRFDCDPAAPKTNIHDYLKNREVSPSIIHGMPVFQDNRIYVVAGGDAWWGKEKVWLKCIDAAQTDDITQTGEIWSYEMSEHSCATPAIAGGLIYVGDTGRLFHCIDAKTGKAIWTHELDRDVWGSALIADGKVYIGTRAGGFWTFAAGKEKKVLAFVDLKNPISSTPVAANGVLYVSTEKHLYAVAREGH